VVDQRLDESLLRQIEMRRLRSWSTARVRSRLAGPERVHLAEPARLAAPERAAAVRQSPPPHCLPRRLSEKFGDRTHLSSLFLPFGERRGGPLAADAAMLQRLSYEMRICRQQY
jgi:hypothetical protein